MNFEQWADKTTDDIIRKVFEAVKTQKRSNELSQHTLSLFLAKFVGNLVYKVLNESVAEAKNKQQAYEMKHAQYLEVKSRVLEAVATGFSAAMENYSGKKIEYYCELRDFTNPANKEPC